ncbi:hypothetical protein KAR26_02775 [Candidatus Parcubacteria bacterium]|nr:hypothetical protein [Candidatus Parcubacteria bacterium]
MDKKTKAHIDLLEKFVEATKTGMIRWVPASGQKDLSPCYKNFIKVQGYETLLGKYVITTEVNIDCVSPPDIAPLLSVKIKREADGAELNITAKDSSRLINCQNAWKGFSLLIFILQIDNMVRQGGIAETCVNERREICNDLEDMLDKVIKE